MNWQELKQASLEDIIAWAEGQPWCQPMADCVQDAEWHSEGDVWTHTKDGPRATDRIGRVAVAHTRTSRPS